MFSPEMIRQMNGTTADDVIHCEVCGEGTLSFWLRNELRVCEVCKEMHDFPEE